MDLAVTVEKLTEFLFQLNIDLISLWYWIFLYFMT